MPRAHGSEPIQRIAQQVADCFSESGYAFVEDDQLGILAAALTSFLIAANIPINTNDEVIRIRHNADS